MTFDYEELEKKLVDACNEVHREFMVRFNDNYYMGAGGGAKLEAFMDGLQKEFETATIVFLKNNNILKDIEAKKRALTITRLYARRCVEDFSKV